MQHPLVVKIGGSTLGNHDTTLADLVALQRKSVPVVVVHGGGKVSTSLLSRLQLPTTFVDGLRVTDTETLKIVVAALAGIVNKELVAQINSKGGKALGLCGVDGGLFEATIKNPALGYVGEIERVKTEVVRVLMEAGYLPVIAPVSLEVPAVSLEAQYLLNVNADTVAGALAVALSAEKLIFLTDVEGLRDHTGKLLPRVSPEEAQELISSGVAVGGMVPKLEACLQAVRAGCLSRILDGRETGALLREGEGEGGGTSILLAR